MAHQKDSFIEEFISRKRLPQLTPNTVTNPVLLEKQLDMIKQQGFAVADSEVQSWTKAIAVPIFDHNNSILASLTMALPRDRLTSDNLHDLISMVKDHALKISHELGYKEKQENR